MDTLKNHYIVNGDDFSVAGENSSKVKRVLKQLGFSPETVRRTVIAMYEAEINMVIHANGGYIDTEISKDKIRVVLNDCGPGIPDIEKAMQEGFSTATNEVRELGFGAGMGLPNMKKYADELNITTEIGKGTRVEIIVNVWLKIG